MATGTVVSDSEFMGAPASQPNIVSDAAFMGTDDGGKAARFAAASPGVQAAVTAADSGQPTGLVPQPEATGEKVARYATQAGYGAARTIQNMQDFGQNVMNMGTGDYFSPQLPPLTPTPVNFTDTTGQQGNLDTAMQASDSQGQIGSQIARGAGGLAAMAPTFAYTGAAMPFGAGPGAGILPRMLRGAAEFGLPSAAAAPEGQRATSGIENAATGGVSQGLVPLIPGDGLLGALARRLATGGVFAAPNLMRGDVAGALPGFGMGLLGGGMDPYRFNQLPQLAPPADVAPPQAPILAPMLPGQMPVTPGDTLPPPEQLQQMARQHFADLIQQHLNAQPTAEGGGANEEGQQEGQQPQGGLLTPPNVNPDVLTAQGAEATPPPVVPPTVAPEQVGNPDYTMSHRPNPDGPPAHDLLEGGLIPNDIYDHPEYYSGEPSAKHFKETVAALRKIRNKPDAPVTVYRASPKNELNSGDWISLSKSYAAQHGMADEPSADVPVHSFKVKAKDIRWAMDDLAEFGYFPKNKPDTALEGPTSAQAPPEPATPTLPPGIISKAVITNPRTGEVMGQQFDVNPKKPESALLPDGRPVGGFTTGPNPTTEEIYTAYNAKRAQFKLPPIENTPQEPAHEEAHAAPGQEVQQEGQSPAAIPQGQEVSPPGAEPAVPGQRELHADAADAGSVPPADVAPAVGDHVQWTSQGADQFTAPKRITDIQEHDGKPYAFVEGEKGAVPLDQLTKAEPESSEPTAEPPNTKTVVAKGEPEPKESTSLKNATTDAELEKIGLPPATHGERMADKQVWQDTLDKVASNPHAGADLVSELEGSNRPHSVREAALLLHEKLRTSAERRAANKDLVDAEATGDKGKIEVAKAAAAAKEAAYQRVNDVQTAGGTATAQGLRFRQAFANEDYSLEGMGDRLRASLGGRPLVPREDYELTAVQAHIAKLDADYAKRVAELKAQAEPAAQQRASGFGARNKVFTADKADAARAALREAMSHLNAGIDPGLIKPLVDLGGYYFEGGLRELGAWSKAMVDELGEKVRPHLDEVFKQAQDQFAAAQTQKNEDARLEGFKTRQTNRAADYEQRVASGNLAPRAKPSPIELDAEAMRLKAQADRAKQAFDEKVRKNWQANRSIPDKVTDKFLQLYRSGIISGPSAIGKIVSGDATDAVLRPYTEAMGGLISKLLPALAQRAPREGGFSPEAERAAITKGIPQGMRDVKDIVKTGKSDRDVLYGKGQRGPSGLTGIPGRIHGALRAVPQAMEFERSLTKRVAAGDEAPGASAYEDSLRAGQLENNPITDAIRAGQAALERPNKATGKPSLLGRSAAVLSKIEMPIVKIPVNVVAQTLENIYGAPVGGARAIMAYARGIKELPPAQGDIIMRQIKRGAAVGVPLMLLGYFNRKNVGGFYQSGEKRSAGDVPAGAFRVGTLTLPALTQMNPYGLTVQFGATIGRILDSMHSGAHPSAEDAVLKSMVGIADELPFFGLSRDIENLKQSPSKFVNKKAQDIVEPQLLQQTARYLDRDAQGNTTARKPVTFGQNIESGIPGLRKNVPLAPVRTPLSEFRGALRSMQLFEKAHPGQPLPANMLPDLRKAAQDAAAARRPSAR